MKKLGIKMCEPCRPPFWANGGHLQTLWGHFLPSPVLEEDGERIEIGVSDGDRIVAHLFRGTTGVVVYLFHGLGGDSHASYMRRTARLARGNGHSVFMFNHRGCGAGQALAKHPYHSGSAEDLSALISYGKEEFPNKFHLAIGFSLSGNALLLLSAKQRAEVIPDASIAVNAPINLHRTSSLLSSGFNRIYDVDFMREMRKAIKVRAQLDKSLADIEIPKFTTLTEFDDLYTAPYGGFRNREEYYATCSAKRYLKDIAIPTVLITAKDDPFVDYADYLTADKNENVFIHVEDRGGHMGYVSAGPTPLGTRRWLDYALVHYMTCLLPPVA